MLKGRDLINTPTSPPGHDMIVANSLTAQAYFSLSPYPFFSFSDWKTESRGPFPKCMPFTQGITRKGAKWLFGKPIHFHMDKKQEKLQTYFKKAWKANRMPARMVAAAESGGQEGSIVLKFNYDENRKDCPLRFDILSPVQNCRLFFDPHDASKLLMLRIQYTYWDPVKESYFWHREEWTDEIQVIYKPLASVTVQRTVNGFPYGNVFVVAESNKNPDNAKNWVVESTKANPFKIIPAWVIHNVETNTQWGRGDLWSLFGVVDRVNLTYHLADRSNQFDSEPTPVYIDLMVESDAYDKPVAPGQAQSLKTDMTAEGAEMRQGKVDLIEPAGKLRPYMAEYARDLRQMIYDAVGYVEVHQGEVTNKGNLTQAVLAQLYAPLIEATAEKRKTYGDDGIAIFLARVALGLSNAKIADFKGITEDDLEDVTPSIVWSDYFELTEAEKQTRSERLAQEERDGLITHEIAVRKTAMTEEVDDVESLVTELKDWEPPVVETGTQLPNKRKPQAKNLQTKSDGSDA